MLDFGPVPGAKFAAGWLPALMTSLVVDPAPHLALVEVDLGGVSLPVVSAVLGAIGVLAARPLARKKESALPLSQFLLVTAIMLVVVELWIIQSHPRWLFAFVVAIGLGFSGYSLIELLGDEIKGLVTSAFALARAKIGALLGTKSKDKSDG